MNAGIIYTLVWFLVEKLFQNFFRVLILLILIYFLIQKHQKKQLFSNVGKLPALKINFYSVFGHLQPLVKTRLKKLPLPAHFYDCVYINGSIHLHAKKGVAYLYQADHPIVFVFKAEHVEAILNNSTELKKAWFYDFFHPALGTGLLTSDGEKWRSRRKLLTKAFHFNILKDFTAIINKHSKIMVSILDERARDDHVEIVELITRCSLDIICGTILSKEVCTQKNPEDAFLKAFHVVIRGIFERMLNPFVWPNSIFKNVPYGKKFFKHLMVAHEFIDNMIQERKSVRLQSKLSNKDDGENRNEKAEDFKIKNKNMIDLLLDEHIDNNSITIEGIKEEIYTFIAEGHDTTSIAMSWTLYLIGLHSWVQEKVHEELDAIFEGDNDRDATDEDLTKMKYLECVIKEAMRIYTPVPLFGREIVEDLDIGDYVIPKGCTCMVASYMLHRDTNVFPNPEKFDPERFTHENSFGRHPFAYVPFSAGPRNCIGQRFAMMEEKIMLSSIMRNFKIRSLDPRDEVYPVGVVILMPHNGLRIQIRRRNEDFDFKKVYYLP